jgi:hypothetical protein
LRGTVTGTSKVRQGSAPEERETVLRPGKKAEYLVDVLEFVGGSVSAKALARVVGGQARDLMSRVVPGLVEELVVEVEGYAVSLVPDWLARLDALLERPGYRETHEHARDLYQEQRANRWKKSEESDRLRYEQRYRDREQIEETPPPVECEDLPDEDPVASVEGVHKMAAGFFAEPQSRLRDALVHTGTAKTRFYRGERRCGRIRETHSTSWCSPSMLSLLATRALLGRARRGYRSLCGPRTTPDGSPPSTT